MLRSSLAAVSLVLASCSHDCNSVTCAAGCCDKGACFEGNGQLHGEQCRSGGAANNGGSCGSHDDPCNAALGLFCCGSYYCSNERCAFCKGSGSDCSSGSTPCCPGLSCALKPGFTTVYECR